MGEGGGKRGKEWENTNLTMEKMLKAFEEMCKKGMGATHTFGGGSRGPSKYSGKVKDPKSQGKPVEDYKTGLQIRCYKCQKPGHIRRECRANIYATDECALTEWYCEEHAAQGEAEEEEEDF